MNPVFRSWMRKTLPGYSACCRFVFMAHERPMRTAVVQHEENSVQRDGWPGKRGDQREDVESSVGFWPRSPWWSWSSSGSCFAHMGPASQETTLFSNGDSVVLSHCEITSLWFCMAWVISWGKTQYCFLWLTLSISDANNSIISQLSTITHCTYAFKLICRADCNVAVNKTIQIFFKLFSV